MESQTEFIINEVCNAFGTEPKEVISKCRTRNFVYSRYAIAFLLTSQTSMNLSQIARRLKLHHATVIHARSLKKTLLMYPDFAKPYNQALEKTRNYHPLAGCYDKSIQL